MFLQSDAAQIKSLKSELKTVTKATAGAGGSAEDVSQYIHSNHLLQCTLWVMQKKELKKKEKEIKGIFANLFINLILTGRTGETI